MRAFSNCGEWGLHSSCGAPASLVLEHGLRWLYHGGLGVVALSRLWAQQLWCIFSLFFSAESTVATLSLLVDFPDILILANNSTVQQRFYQYSLGDR